MDDPLRSWREMVDKLNETGNEIVVDTFDLDKRNEESIVDVNNQNYKTFKIGASAWTTEDGSKWLYMGDGIFHFRLKWGKSGARPELDSTIVLTRKTKNGRIIVSCCIERFVVQDRAEIGVQISKSCGVAILRLIHYDVELNVG